MTGQDFLSNIVGDVDPGVEPTKVPSTSEEVTRQLPSTIDFRSIVERHYPDLAKAKGHIGDLDAIPEVVQDAYIEFARRCFYDAKRELNV